MDEGMVKCGLEAAAARLPFMPIRAGLGSDVLNFWGDELKTVYEDLNSRLVHDKKKREITVAAAGAAIVFLIAGALLSGLWFRRIV